MGARDRQSEDALLRIADLSVHYRSGHVATRALDNLSLTVRRGETVGLVGVSGAGKSVLARSIMGLIREPGHIAGGSIHFGDTQLLGLAEQPLNAIRGKDIALIVANPRARLNPVLSVGTQLANLLRAKQKLGRSEANDRAVELLQSVSIGDARRVARSLPHELSGGMCQRVIIAMALASSPALLVADEPTAGLDVTVQMQVLELMKSLVDEKGSALLLMTRDLGIVAHFAQRVAVLMNGQIVEERPTAEFFADPSHPHSSFLLRAAFAARGDR